MKRLSWSVLVCLMCVLAVMLPACNNAGGISVAFVQAATQAIDNGQTFNITAAVKNDSSNKGVTWLLVSGPGTLTNETTTSATYNAPVVGAVAHRVAQQATPQAAVIKATSVADSSKSATITINVTPPPSMSNQTLAGGTEGTAYSQPVVETGGAGTLSWQIIAQPGPQPAGLSINSGTGVISGTPTGPNGTSTFTVKVTDSNAGNAGPQSAQAQVTITINLPAPPKINPAGSALPAGTEGLTYSQTLTVSGGLANFSWSVIGNLPAGLTGAPSADTKSFTISGKPTGPNGISNFQVKVTDSSNPTQSDTESYSITINLPAPPKINPAGGALAAGTEGSPYSQPALTVNGGLANFTWTLIGSLPAGLTGTQSPGGATFAISGTPTGPNGTANFQIKVTDSSNPTQSDTESFSITINLPAPPKINPAGGALAAGTEGSPYSQPPLTVSGGLGNFTWTVVGGDTSLPAGLHSAQSGTNNNTFTISGTPTGPNGTTNFQIKVTDSSNPPQSDTENYSIAINLPPPPQISPASGALPAGNVGTPVTNLQFTVSGGLGPTFTWSESGTLPAGLTFNVANSTGATVAITGTPTTAQSNVPFSVTVMDSSNPKQSITNNYTLTINPPAPFMITTSSLLNGNFNQFYSTNISAQGGIAPYTFSLDASSSPLPSGLSFSSSNNQGTISGTPTTAGTFTNIIVDAHDSQATPATDQKTYTLTIMAPTLIFMPTNNSALPTGTQNQVYAGVTISASGGVQPYTFTQDATSQLPTGLTFTPGTNQATITGTPTQTGTFNVVVDFQDSEHPPVMQKLNYTLTVNASVAACGSGSEALMTGQYTAVLQGHDSSGPVGIGLVFDTDGKGGVAKGGIGIEDINSNGPSGVQQNLSIDSSKSSYSIGSDHRFCLTVVTGTTNQTFRGSLSSISGTPAVAANGHIIEFDTTGSNTAGIVRLQDKSAFNISVYAGSNFVFGASGAKASGGKFGVAGLFSIATGGTIPSGSLDVNDNGTLDGVSTNTTFPASPVPFNGSSSISSSNGRGGFTFNVPGTSGVHGLLYAVSAGELLAMSSDSQAVNTLFVGKVFKQTQASFSTTDVTGKTYVVYTSGLAKSVAGGTRASLGTFIPTSASAFNITLNQNDGGALTTQSGSGTYSLASDGRELAQITGANHNTALYLASPTLAFALDGSGQVETGFAEAQSGSPFGNGSAKSPPPYSFGTIHPEVASVDINSGVANFDGVSTVTGASDDNSNGTLNPGNAFSQAYSINSTGTGSIPHSGTSCSFTAGTCDLIFIVISPPSSSSPFGKAALMDAKPASGSSNTTPSLMVADQ